MDTIQPHARHLRDYALAALPLAFALPRTWNTFAYEAMAFQGSNQAPFWFTQVAILCLVCLISTLGSPRVRQAMRRVGFSIPLNLLLGLTPLAGILVPPGSVPLAPLVLPVLEGACLITSYLQVAVLMLRLGAPEAVCYCLGSFALAALGVAQLSAFPVEIACVIVTPFPLLCALAYRAALARTNQTGAQEPGSLHGGKPQAHYLPYLVAFLIAGLIMGYFQGFSSVAEASRAQVALATLFKVALPAALIALFLHRPRIVDVRFLSLTLMALLTTMLVVVYFATEGSTVATAAEDWARWSMALVLFHALLTLCRSVRRLSPLASFGAWWGAYIACMGAGWLAGQAGVVPFSQADMSLCCIYVLVICVTISLLLDVRSLRDGAPRPHGHFDEDTFAAVSEVIAPRCEALANSGGLTAREAEVLPLLCLGLPKTTIAERLCISEDTVRTHVKRIYKKLAIHTSQELSDTFWKGGAGHEPQ